AGVLRSRVEGAERAAARLPHQPQPHRDRRRRVRPQRRAADARGRPRGDRRRDRGRVRRARRRRHEHLHARRRQPARRRRRDRRGCQRRVRRGPADRRVRHHRRPRRARARPRPASRRIGDDRRPGLRGHARARRLRPLVQGDPRSRGSARFRRSLSAIPEAQAPAATPAAWLRRPAIELVAMAALGALQTAAFVAGDLWPLQLVAIALLSWRVGAASPRRAAALGFAFATAWICAGTWWLFVSMHRYGGLAAPLAALAVLGLAASLALYFAAAMALVAKLRPRSPARSAVCFAAAWLLAELARAVLFTGFPWAASGYAHVDSPLAGFAPWLGVYGIGALAAGLAARFGFADLRRARGWIAPASALAVALVAGALLGSVDFSSPTRTLTVSLLQGNVPQQEKFEPAYLAEGLAATAQQIQSARG